MFCPCPTVCYIENRNACISIQTQRHKQRHNIKLKQKLHGIMLNLSKNDELKHIFFSILFYKMIPRCIEGLNYSSKTADTVHKTFITVTDIFQPIFKKVLVSQFLHYILVFFFLFYFCFLLKQLLSLICTFNVHDINIYSLYFLLRVIIPRL